MFVPVLMKLPARIEFNTLYQDGAGGLYKHIRQQWSQANLVLPKGHHDSLVTQVNRRWWWVTGSETIKTASANGREGRMVIATPYGVV